MTTASPTKDLDARDRRCVRCGYSLLGHTDDAGRCPECGLPVYWSLRAPERLSHYPASWVASMARGTEMLFIVYAMAATFAIISLQGWVRETAFNAGVGLAICAAAQLAGMWMLSRSSGHWAEPPSGFVRFLLRVTPLGPLVAAAMTIAMDIRYHPALIPVAVAGMIVGALAPTAVFVRLRTVARLIADAGLAEHSAIVGWGFFLTFVLAPPIAFLLDAYRQRVPDWVMLIVMGVALTAALLFLIWGAFIMFCCLIDFGRAAKIAQAEWKATGEGPA